MKKIALTFQKDLTKLVGNSFGRKTYENQIKGNVDFEEKVTIEIPSRINRISSSFVQGFFDEIIQTIGVNGVKEKFTFISSINEIKDFIINNLE